MDRNEVIAEIDSLDIASGGNGAAEAILFTFFRSVTSPDIADNLSADDVLGYAILINYREAPDVQFSRSYIFEAVFKPPAKYEDGKKQPLLNNFIQREAVFDLSLFGKIFPIQGVYYCQQNSKTSCCAHAALRMALRTIGAAPAISNETINCDIGSATPGTGLTIQEIETVISKHKNVESKITDCSLLPDGSYLSILGSVVESGDLALLVFTTAQEVEHVVTVFGYTRNSDEWHPQAIPAYSGPQSAKHYASSAWMDHFLIHDDNFGPYYTLSTRALEVDPSVKPHWIIALQKVRVNVWPAFAETLASMALQSVLPSLAGLNGCRWLEYITRQQWVFVLRPLLVSRADFLQHLANLKGHDGSSVEQSELPQFEALPEYFWMVEFSLPSLYTGNRSKLGEVYIDANSPLDINDPTRLVLGLRIPEFTVMRGDEGFFPASCHLHSHAPIFSARDLGCEW